MTRKRIWLRRVLLLAFALTLLTAGLVTWVVRSESGARQVINFALAKIDAEVEIGVVTGSLSEGLTVSEVDVESAGIHVQIQQIELQLGLSGLFKRNVVVKNLAVRDVAVSRFVDQIQTGSEKAPTEIPRRISLPVNLAIQQLSIENVEIGDGTQSTQTVIDHVNLTGQWSGTRLELTQFDIKAPAAALNGSLELATQKPFPLTVSSTSRVTGNGFATINLTSRLSGSLERMNVSVTGSTPYKLDVSGALSNVLINPQFKFDMTTNALELSEVNSNVPELSVTSALHVQGSLEEFQVKGQVDTNFPELGGSSTKFESRVFSDRFELTESSTFLPEIENGSTVNAFGQISWSSGEPKADLTFTWDQFQWPLRGDHQLLSRQGRVELSGTQTQYSLSARSELSTRYETDGNFSLEATGTSERLDVNALHIEALEGHVNATANVIFGDNLAVAAKIEGSGIDPSSLHNDWPGVLSFNVNGSGNFGDSNFSASLREFNGQGELRGYPLSFDGDADITPDNIAINGLRIDSGPTQIELSGTVSELIDVTWSLTSSDLESVWPGLSGEAESRGVASGRRDQPKLDFSIDGREMGYGDGSVDELKANIEFGVSEEGAGIANIEISGGEFASYTLENLKLLVSGTQQQHTVELAAIDGLGKSHVLFDGSLDHKRDYTLKIDKVDIDTEELGKWSLLEPVSGIFGTHAEIGSAVNFPNTCLTQNFSKLCVGLESIDNILAANVEVAQFPLTLLSHFLPFAVKADGMVNGGGRLNVNPAQDSYGNFEFSFDDFQVQARDRQDRKDSTLRFDTSAVTANIERSGEVVLNADFPLTSGGGFTVQGKAAQSDQAFLTRPVSGRMTLSVPSAAFIADYIPQLSKAQGRLEGAIDLSGTLRQPELLGNVELSAGQFTFVDPGIQATDVAIGISGKANNLLAIDASARSGGGELKLTGEISFGEREKGGELHLTGTEFQVLNTTELQLWATPDVKLSYVDNQLFLKGSVLIPQADIDIDALPQGTVEVSDDQVIVGDEERVAAETVSVNAELLLSLGKSVHLSAFGLDANLGGELKLIEETGKPTTATGEILLREGKYQAYGQKLTLTTGRLVYAGGPIDQPGVDLRATRTPVSGIEVGVTARGTLSQPQFSLFSTPAMPESDQLAYLIFGRPINTEAGSENTLVTRLALSLGMQGGEALSQKLAGELGVDQLGVESQSGDDFSQASLVIGKYLSPKLFVSYGIGLLEPVSTLKLEYALNSKWQLITESSSTRNSADAQYTYER